MSLSLVIVLLFQSFSISSFHVDGQTLDDIIEGENSLDNTIPSIKVGESPGAVALNDITNTLYVANPALNKITIIDFNKLILNDIRVGVQPEIIHINEKTNKVYVGNRVSQTISVIDGANNIILGDVKVSNWPADIQSDDSGERVFVTGLDQETITVIDGFNNTKIADVKIGEDIDPTGLATKRALAADNAKIYVSDGDSGNISIYRDYDYENLGEIEIGGVVTDMVSNYRYLYAAVTDFSSSNVSVIDILNNITVTDLTLDGIPVLLIPDWTNEKLFVMKEHDPIDQIPDTVSVIDIRNNTIVADLSVGTEAADMVSNSEERLLYVSNTDSDSVSVFDTRNYTLVGELRVGSSPTHMALSEEREILYISNTDSDSISVISGLNVMSGVTLNVNPRDSGNIKCNGIDFPTRQFIYVNPATNCIAEPTRGYQFNSWTENLGDNSLITLSKSEPSYFLIDTFIKFFNTNENSPAHLDLTRFGNFTANFSEIPPPIPAEYLATLFTIVISAFVGSWLTPAVIEWRKNKNQGKKLKYYHFKIKDLYRDDVLNQNDTIELDHIRENLTGDYIRGKITKDQYEKLVEETSILYSEIYKNEIYSLSNQPQNDLENKRQELKNKLEDSYSMGKLNEVQYNLLKTKLSL
jgi:YVTN family beta-propeller protein